MAKIKKIIALAIVVVGVFFYASQPTARSLYSTKADASSEYVSIGRPSEQVAVSQLIVPDNNRVQQLELLVNTAVQSEADLVWRLETLEGQVVATANGAFATMLNTQKTKLVFPLENTNLKTGQMYVLKIEGQLGGLLYHTKARFDNQTVTINGKNEKQSLVAKVIYQGLHVHTFAVLLGLIAYIVLFMSVMLKLFR